MRKTWMPAFAGMTVLLVGSLQMSFANPCSELAGNWQGEWQDENHKTIVTKLNIEIKNNDHFEGQFIFSDGTGGSFAGTCKELKSSEAYLILREDPPWFNPCRGTLLNRSPESLLHIYCFKPNQAGYFNKS